MVQEKLERAVLSTNKRKISRLKSELSRVEEFHGDTPLFSLKLAGWTILSLAIILMSIYGGLTIVLLEWLKSTSQFINDMPAITNIIWGMEVFVIASLMFVIVMGIRKLLDFIADIRRLITFNNYKDEVLQEINNLENKENKAAKKNIRKSRRST
jgi:flagellar biosynthesis protein FlhB